MELEESVVAESGDRGRVKVVDRRRFTSEGDFREPARESAAAAPEPTPTAPADREAEPTHPAPAAASVAPAGSSVEAEPSAVAPEPPPEEPGPLPPSPGLADIVDLLAQQAMAFLSGQVPGRGRDPATARFFIDLLGVLKEKTTGRRTLEETNFLDDILYQLRSLYVAATR
jgi:hypothetical protein